MSGTIWESDHLLALTLLSSMKLYIKYMVSLRCKMIVKAELESLGIHSISIELGLIEIHEKISAAQTDQLRTNLLHFGLELMNDKKSILIDKIKNVIIDMVHYNEELPKVNYSDYISEKLNYDYTYLSNIFSEVKGTTIQHFIIVHKVEKIKELLLYNQLNLSEISHKLHYSSVAHLSNQFKKITGLSPSFFKKMGNKRAGNLEDL